MKTKERVLQGISISKGIAIGVPFFHTVKEALVPEYPLEPEEVEKEICLYKNALNQSEEEIQLLQSKFSKEGQREVVAILDSHLQILHDPLITTEIEQKIRSVKKNSAYIFTETITFLKNRLQHSGDYFFQERARDVTDIYKRVLSHLLEKKSQVEEPPPNVFISLELIPSLAAEAHPQSTVAFITQLGGISSHAAIIARAKNIPYIAGIEVEALKKEAIHMLIVDGTQGKVILNPKEETLQNYRALKAKSAAFFLALEEQCHLDAETLDGYPIKIMGNVDSWEDLPLLKKHGAAGIGLFRTEYLLFSGKKILEEKQQIQAYRSLIEAVPPSQPVILRVFDLGGDKPYLSLHKKEPNPVLGFRAIRLLLREKRLFMTQLRAILQANLHQNLHLLLPMISDMEEIRQVRLLLREVAAELRKEGIFFHEKIFLGCMIEAPSLALLCDVLCQEVDFLSIGTNDLVQHVLAVDRSNPHVSYLYDPLHPSILRLIRMILLSCGKHKKPVLLCGEMAAEPFYLPCLLGMGLKKLSVSLRYIPLVKHMVRKLEIIACCQLAEEVLQMVSSQEIRTHLQKTYKKWKLTFPPVS